MTEQRHYQESDAGVEWSTPRYIWQPLADALNGFTLDPASGAEATPIAAQTFTEADNGLAQDWRGDVWVNPPYSREDNPKWARKAYGEAQRSDVDTITALVPSATGSDWFQSCYATADYLTLVDHRVSFGGAESGASFDVVIASFGSFPEEYRDALAALGCIVEPRQETTQTTLET